MDDQLTGNFSGNIEPQTLDDRLTRKERRRQESENRRADSAKTARTQRRRQERDDRRADSAKTARTQRKNERLDLKKERQENRQQFLQDVLAAGKDIAESKIPGFSQSDPDTPDDPTADPTAPDNMTLIIGGGVTLLLLIVGAFFLMKK